MSDHVTSHEVFYQDPQFGLWIEEIQERLAERSKIAWFKKNLLSWFPKKIKWIFVQDQKELFVRNLLKEGENPMPLMDHIDSMRKTGFTDVIVEYRYSNFGIVSARKREEIHVNI